VPVFTGPASESPDALNRVRRAELERQAALLLIVASLTMAIVCGAVIVSGWFAGVLVDRWERVFWAGSILGFISIAVFAAAAAPGGADARRTCVRVTWLMRVGLLLFVAAPALCILAMAGDFYRL
jgi:MFS family permease